MSSSPLMCSALIELGRCNMFKDQHFILLHERRGFSPEFLALGSIISESLNGVKWERGGFNCKG